MFRWSVEKHMVDSMIESDTKKTLASPKAPKNNSLIQFLAKIQKLTL